MSSGWVATRFSKTWSGFHGRAERARRTGGKMSRHRHTEYLRFLREIDRRTLRDPFIFCMKKGLQFIDLEIIMNFLVRPGDRRCVSRRCCVETRS